MHTRLGLDVSKQWLDVCLYNPATKPIYQKFSNDAKGHNELIDYVNQEAVKLVVCEPPGGYERAICEHGSFFLSV